MEMPLAYRIASISPVGDADMSPLVAEQRAKILGIPKLCFSNIAEFYAAHDRQFWRLKEDIPNWAPPFEEFFAEWDHPVAAKWNVPEPVTSNIAYQHGFYCRTIPSSERLFFSQALKVLPSMTHMDGSQVLRLDSCSKILLDSEQAKWVLACSAWGSCSQKPSCGRPIFHGVNSALFISSTGKLVEFMVWGAKPILHVSHSDLEGYWKCLHHILGLGLSFCHCKNVTVTEQAQDRGERWHRRTKTPILKFHTLNIDPMKKIIRREGQSDQVGLAKALHICRGHFATYTPEHPLFGKYVGTYWRPDHVRGSIQAGAVVSDYNVNPATE